MLQQVSTPGAFDRISIPLVRRIYPQMIASDLVNVQPMQGPTGLIYYLRHQYSQNSGGRRIPRRVYDPVPCVCLPDRPDWRREGF